ncbi:glycosyltransferase [Mycolicibacterium thermoresistibile]
MTRVLVITKTAFDNPTDGGTLRVSAVATQLQQAGFDVDAVAVRAADGRRHRTPTPTVAAAVTDRNWWSAATVTARAVVRVGSVSVARWYSPATGARIASLLSRHRYAAVVLEHSQLLIYRDLLCGTPVILDMHNVEHELLANYAKSARTRWARALATYEAARMRKLERRARILTDAVVTVSPRDAAAVQRSAGAAKVVTAPNGVSDRAFTVDRAAADFPTIVFIAHLGWKPNIDGAHWLVREVWPVVRRRCPTARLQLIGKAPAASVRSHHGIDGITVHPDVPSTLPYLGRAAVATAPLLAAGGTRLKILESLATGTPVVATSLGAMGLEHLVGDGGLVIEDDAGRYAAALLRLLDRPADPAAVGRRVEGYRWHRTLAPLVDVVREKAGP